MKRDVAIYIPYKIKDGQVLVYLERRSKTAARLPDWYGFWGGGIEPGETTEQTLLREAKEEMSIDLKDYKFYKGFSIGESSKYVYLLEVDDNFESEIKITEAQYGKFFTQAEMNAEDRLIETDKMMLNDFFSHQSVEGLRK